VLSAQGEPTDRGNIEFLSTVGGRRA